MRDSDSDGNQSCVAIANVVRDYVEGLVQGDATKLRRVMHERACEIGLVNRVVPRDRLMAEARALADTICLNGPMAIRACKRSAKESTFLPLREALENEMSFSAEVFMSDDAKEGIRAFKEKRPPVWKNR